MKATELKMGYVWTICLVAACGGLLFGYDWVVIGGEVKNGRGIVNGQRDRLVCNNIRIVIANQRNAERRFNREVFHERFLMPEYYQIT